MDAQKIEAIPVVSYSMLVNHLGPSSANLLSRTVWKDGIDIEVPCEGIQRLCKEYAAQTLASKEAEIARLTACLSTANNNAEKFEREWYLRGDEIERLRAALLAWKTEAEYQYGQLRLQRNPSETDYPVDGALDAYARGKHPAIAALTQPTE